MGSADVDGKKQTDITIVNTAFHLNGHTRARESEYVETGYENPDRQYQSIPQGLGGVLDTTAASSDQNGDYHKIDVSARESNDYQSVTNSAPPKGAQSNGPQGHYQAMLPTSTSTYETSGAHSQQPSGNEYQYATRTAARALGKAGDSAPEAQYGSAQHDYDTTLTQSGMV